MNKRLNVMPFAIFTLIGALGTVSCAARGGIMRADGSITPCDDWHTDNQACGNALFNSKVIGQVKLGQTQDDVMAIVRHAPERRKATATPDAQVETWSYITDYQAELMTTLTFTNGKLTAIGQEPWKP
jgi:hypothetical protein